LIEIFDSGKIISTCKYEEEIQEEINILEQEFISKQKVRDAIEHSKVNIKQGDDEFISKNQLLKELNLGEIK